MSKKKSKFTESEVFLAITLAIALVVIGIQMNTLHNQEMELYGIKNPASWSGGESFAARFVGWDSIEQINKGFNDHGFSSEVRLSHHHIGGKGFIVSISNYQEDDKVYCIEFYNDNLGEAVRAANKYIEGGQIADVPDAFRSETKDRPPLQ